MKTGTILEGPVLCALVTGMGLALTSCGTTPGVNADVPNVFYTSAGGRPVIASPSGVEVTASGPSLAEGGVKVVGVSCKNKLWDPAPSKENALNLMKKQAAEKGMNAVHSVVTENDPAALLKNCWSAIKCTGIAYRK